MVGNDTPPSACHSRVGGNPFLLRFVIPENFGAERRNLSGIQSSAPSRRGRRQSRSFSQRRGMGAKAEFLSLIEEVETEGNVILDGGVAEMALFRLTRIFLGSIIPICISNEQSKRKLSINC